ncbi:hypothetical protein CEXT_419961 [Caerostris extrusa]|uniref:Uncharacterized protein n=1 Tax=Caerostris extrusa TaxID=172846 RepID=A0AAV4XH36_CAEEX|nr:hypothetical protein CEXT_419961 [Caerostris extrusa]
MRYPSNPKKKKKERRPKYDKRMRCMLNEHYDGDHSPLVVLIICDRSILLKIQPEEPITLLTPEEITRVMPSVILHRQLIDFRGN